MDSPGLIRSFNSCSKTAEQRGRQDDDVEDDEGWFPPLDIRASGNDWRDLHQTPKH